MHLSSFQESVLFASIYLMVCSISHSLGLSCILVPPRGLTMALLHSRACPWTNLVIHSGLSGERSKTSHLYGTFTILFMESNDKTIKGAELVSAFSLNQHLSLPHSQAGMPSGLRYLWIYI